jgi:succinyl-diaminopimelate desuccinylase
MDGNKPAPVNQKEMLSVFSKMISIPAVSPVSGGTGEGKRADYLQKVLASWGLKVTRYDYKDKSKVNRSNLVVKYGKKARTLWLISHIDTVSAGDIKLWKTDPFKAVIRNGSIYGRGTSDDGSGLIPSLYTLKSLMGKKLRYNVGLVLAADEENGSAYGVHKLLKERIFEKEDMFIIPDWGNPKGSEIEIAEKSLLWLKFTVKGKQVHASDPDLGLNAFKASAIFALQADSFLHKKYTKKTSLFPDGSTFEMTKHEKNVDSINILPGTDVFYMDCRIIPDYDPSAVIGDLKRLASKQRAKIKIEVDNREDTPAPTSPKSEVVLAISKAIRKELGMTPRPIGLGGGTVAKPLRASGFDVVVWKIEDNVAHQPNEYAKISAINGMIRVFQRLYL